MSLNAPASADETVRAYYDALRAGEALEPFVLPGESTIKFGISEALFGASRVCEALRTQTETTTDWTVESHHLVVDQRDGFATMADEVTMAWTDAESEERKAFETRWSGTLVREATTDPSGGEQSTAATSVMASDRSTAPWRFATLHVSTSEEF
ncbi:hypothetical protein [Natrarchaeobaculum aegyptiacum]|uniref:SnoaL-like domain-containing protein n=1 Tax=Natrarchaeobaculum aegyptiacum TaxID=745377 RepID=A0A2Z2I3F4_9EURY|nr:hypothetical protein [Natrarchaeobaculum aegyptiacum]ARS91838.1 hypothetical protein B1756_12655 [Natrarchaeobaculum aegyptiacum]